MAKQKNLDVVYLKMAYEWGKLSCAKRKQVGCLIVSNSQIISDGFNGTPAGFGNKCEDEEGKTKREVLHAETNAIAKISKSTQSSEGATMYTTLSPCFDCSKLIIQAGITRVVYGEKYHDFDGVTFLKKFGIKVEYLNFRGVPTHNLVEDYIL